VRACALCVEVTKLVGPGPRQQRPDQALLRAEQEQQDPGAGADSGRERPQRQIGEPVLECVAVGVLEQLILARRRGPRGRGPRGRGSRCHPHDATVPLKRLFQWPREGVVGEMLCGAAMNESRIVIRPVGKPGDLGWMVQAHGELYAAEFGWDSTFEALVARIVADFAADPGRPGQRGWISEVDGRRMGCVLCVSADDAGEIDGATAQLRILLIDPAARGNGIGARLVDECVGFARTAGYTRMKLWTNDPLVAARRIYLSRGFTLVDEEPHHSYGADLVGQIYELDLRRSPNPPQPAGSGEQTHLRAAGNEGVSVVHP
jgi:GNAT superfamily N-acetyltransferase